MVTQAETAEIHLNLRELEWEVGRYYDSSRLWSWHHSLYSGLVLYTKEDGWWNLYLYSRGSGEWEGRGWPGLVHALRTAGVRV